MSQIIISRHRLFRTKCPSSACTEHKKPSSPHMTPSPRSLFAGCPAEEGRVLAHALPYPNSAVSVPLPIHACLTYRRFCCLLRFEQTESADVQGGVPEYQILLRLPCATPRRYLCAAALERARAQSAGGVMRVHMLSGRPITKHPPPEHEQIHTLQHFHRQRHTYATTSLQAMPAARLSTGSLSGCWLARQRQTPTCCWSSRGRCI